MKTQLHRHLPRARTQAGSPHPIASLRLPLRCFAVTLLLWGGFLFSFSLLAYFLPDPRRLLLPLGLAATALSALLGGAYAAKHGGGRPLLSAACNALLLSLTRILASLFFAAHASAHTPHLALLLHASPILISLLGAKLASLPPRPRKKRRRA